MTATYSTVVAAHGIVGGLALVSFWGAAALRKGSSLHRRIGQAYLLAMLGVIVTAIPLAAIKYEQGQTVVAAFLAYLAIITATGVWSAWRAIRDKHDVVRYTGRVYAVFGWLCFAAGLGVMALGAKAGSPLLAGFSIIGIFVGQDMLRKRRDPSRLAAEPRWWLKEHYSAMLGNGIATHVAFLAIGLPRLLPAIDGTALQYAAWFGPVGAALIAKLVIDRRAMPAARLRAT